MHEIKLPQLGQSVEEAKIVEWYKSEGDAVAKGEPLFSVETDKAEIDCEATAAGVLRKILARPGEIVPVMQLVAYVGEANEPVPDAALAAAETTAPSIQTMVFAKSAAPAVAAAVMGAIRAVSPRAGAVARELGVSIERVNGTGPNGRVIERDVRAFAESGAATAPRPIAAVKQPLTPGTRVPLTAMRATVARRMSESKFSAPHYYTTVEVDMSAAKKLRGTVAGFKPTYNDFVLAAAVQALKAVPAVNAQWLGDAVHVADVINLGMAVALDEGLIVPVIRDAQEMTLRKLNEAAAKLAEKAKTHRLLPDDYAGSTFTVSNLGAFGVDQFTAIINSPDSAILAIGRMEDRPVVREGQVVIRPMMKVTLSSDHRVIDGALAARFVAAFKEALEAAAFAV